MLFRKQFLEGIADGSVKLAFRRWQRPSVRSGGTLLTPLGQLEIVSVRMITRKEVSEQDAVLAGYASRSALLAELDRRKGGCIYRIDLGKLRVDPRKALRETTEMDRRSLEALRNRLTRMDARSRRGSWTRQTLEVVATHPGVRAGDLCILVGQDKEQFKLNLRKLKSLGLTESLGTGYRVSPRGQRLLTHLREFPET